MSPDADSQILRARCGQRKSSRKSDAPTRSFRPRSRPHFKSFAHDCGFRSDRKHSTESHLRSHKLPFARPKLLDLSDKGQFDGIFAGFQLLIARIRAVGERIRRVGERIRRVGERIRYAGCGHPTFRRVQKCAFGEAKFYCLLILFV